MNTSTTTGRPWQIAAAAAALAALAACGSDYAGGSPTTPSGSGAGASGATITIAANGAIGPTQVTISAGQSVTFVNSDSRAHQIASNPHPTHTDCPSINALGTLAAGETRLTNAFTGAGTCGFHDHNEPDNGSLKGTILIR